MTDLRPTDWEGNLIDKNIADDLADVLASMTVGFMVGPGVMLSDHPEIKRVMQRHAAWKIPCEAHVWHGPGHQSKTGCEVRGEHTEHYARLLHGEVEWSGFMMGSVDDNGEVHEREYCAEGDGCHALRDVRDSSRRLCNGYMHPRNR